MLRAVLPLLALVSGSVAVGADDDLLLGLKVSYLFNFTRFVEWPAQALGGRFPICVVEDAPLAAALSALERRGEEAAGRPIAVRLLTAADALRDGADCAVLFIGSAARARAGPIVAATAGRPVLTVGDSPGLARAGVAINFMRRPDILGAGERLRFELNPRALQGRGLKVSAQLYAVAEIVR